MFFSTLILSTIFSLSAAPTDTLRQEQLDEVVVKSNSARQRLRQIQTGAEQVQLKDLTASPQLFGEQDVMRSLQLLTGVKSESDASSSFQVRGGTSAQKAKTATAQRTGPTHPCPSALVRDRAEIHAAKPRGYPAVFGHR